MEPRTVLLTGAAGLVGTWLRRRAPADATVVPVVHRHRIGGALEVAADLRDADRTETVFATGRPDLVLHAAYAKDRDAIVTVTANVVGAAARHGADVVHLSTDSVFAGDGAPRTETDEPDPVSDYGVWKAEAERIARSEGAAVVRLPLISSLDPPDHAVAQIRHGAEVGKPTEWWHDEVRQPASAAELADALWAIAALDADRRRVPWHLMGPERLSRAEIAARVLAVLDLDPACIRVEGAPTDARRPKDLWLTSERAARDIGWGPTPVLMP